VREKRTAAQHTTGSLRAPATPAAAAYELRARRRRPRVKAPSIYHPAVPQAFWAAPADALFTVLGSAPAGLSDGEAARRLAAVGPNRPGTRKTAGNWALLARQFRAPASMLLTAAAVLAGFLGDRGDAAVVITIVVASALLGFWQERGAAGAVEELLRRLRTRATVVRGGRAVEIAAEEVVPGDVLALSAGSAVAGDARVLDANCLYVDEAALTGESFPAEKAPGASAADAPLAGRGGAVFAGTHVVSGSGTALVVATGDHTVFGEVAGELAHRAPVTGFERGVRRFGYLLLEITLVLVVSVLAVNVLRGRPPLESLLFTLALAVGLAPELLPAIVSVTLAHGARRMAAARVIVRRLVAIEDFGGMTVLCTDKTGTLTEGTVRLDAALDTRGKPSERVFLHAYLNATLQSAFANPLDAAIRAHPSPDVSAFRKTGEVPYDFTRKRLSVVVETGDERLLVMKGALPNVLAACTRAEDGEGRTVPLDAVRGEVEARFEALSRDGFRCLGVAVRALPAGLAAGPAAEREMTFLGTLALADPPRADADEAVAGLGALGITVKMLTGDNRHVAAAVAARVGLGTRVVAAAELRAMGDAALVRRAPGVDVFAELDPHDKERILRALRKTGETVGYLGDGINDAPALHAADVGISVDGAVDVARQAASVVLLEKSLEVLAEGVREGRRAFGNTLKYVFVTMSANFGNMFSMAVASLFSTFLPLLPRQILLINVLSDLPAMSIAQDRLDPEMVARPRRWDVAFVRDFMVVFGIVSSVFDLATFAVLWWMRAPVAEFRTAWFLESMASELLILLVIRTRRPFLKSRPGAALAWTSLGVGMVTLALPYLPWIGPELGFTPVTLPVMLAIAALVIAYVAASEVAKHAFYRRRPA
jgi:P-type Mg2+ transporter